MSHILHATRALMTWSLILLAVFPWSGSAAWAQGSAEAPQVTLHARKMPFLVALRRITDQSHTRYRFDPEAAALLLNTFVGGSLDAVSLDITDMPADHAIAYLLRRAFLIDDLTFREDKYVLGRGKMYVFSCGNGLADQKATVHLVNVPLVDALKQLCEPLGANYAFNLGRYEREPVTVSLDNMPVRKCAQAMLEAAHALPELAFEAINGMAIVGYKQNYIAGAKRRTPLEDVITLKCSQQNAYYAAFAIADSASEYFTLSDDLKSRDVSLTLNSIPLRLVVQSIGTCLKTPLVSGFDGGVLLIALKHPKNGGYTNCPPGVPESQQQRDASSSGSKVGGVPAKRR